MATADDFQKVRPRNYRGHGRGQLRNPGYGRGEATNQNDISERSPVNLERLENESTTVLYPKIFEIRSRPPQLVVQANAPNRYWNATGIYLRAFLAFYNVYQDAWMSAHSLDSTEFVADGCTFVYALRGAGCERRIFLYQLLSGVPDTEPRQILAKRTVFWSHQLERHTGAQFYNPGTPECYEYPTSGAVGYLPEHCETPIDMSVPMVPIVPVDMPVVPIPDHEMNTFLALVPGSDAYSIVVHSPNIMGSVHGAQLWADIYTKLESMDNLQKLDAVVPDPKELLELLEPKEHLPVGYVPVEAKPHKKKNRGRNGHNNAQNGNNR